ncbi:hypothetical protein RSO01_60740 [Reyranella soli]|uniref:Uncharacterized protein n=1 Tax=Reyranella soli TaxID=1230389 RepID=A0A512NIY7_9HYPH|nr:hypothetical protein RSO01_60740 [Reyranella soli]
MQPPAARYACEGGRARVIPRPGRMVGEGTSPFHVIGWNRGTDRLPFVLVADVAAAMLGVLR